MSAEPASGGFGAALTPRGRIRGKVPRRLVADIKECVGRGPSAVEIGAGTGILSGALLRAGCRIVSVEADAVSVAQLRRSLTSAAVLMAQPGDLPLRTGSIDAMLINWSLSPTDLERSMVEVGRVVGDGSKVIVLRRQPATGDPGSAAADGVRIPDWLHQEGDGVRYGESFEELELTMSVWRPRQRS